MYGLRSTLFLNSSLPFVFVGWGVVIAVFDIGVIDPCYISFTSIVFNDLLVCNYGVMVPFDLLNSFDASSSELPAVLLYSEGSFGCF